MYFRFTALKLGVWFVVCNGECKVLNQWKDNLCQWMYDKFLIFIFTTLGISYCVAAAKSRPNFFSVLLYSFWSLGIISSSTFSIENWIPLKPALGLQGERCCSFHYLSRTGSIKPSLLILVWLLSSVEWSTFFTRIFMRLELIQCNPDNMTTNGSCLTRSC